MKLFFRFPELLLLVPLVGMGFSIGSLMMIVSWGFHVLRLVKTVSGIGDPHFGKGHV